LHPYKKQIQALKQGYLILIYFSFWFILLFNYFFRLLCLCCLTFRKVFPLLLHQLLCHTGNNQEARCKQPFRMEFSLSYPTKAMRFKISSLLVIFES
jgi:hypothetical protein